MTLPSVSKTLQKIIVPERYEAYLWRQVKSDHPEKYRNILFEKYMGIATRIARNEYYKRSKFGLELSDYEQLAFTGLLQAIERFDPLKNVEFKYYARKRIVGSIIDGIKCSNEDSSFFYDKKKRQTERVNSIVDNSNRINPEDVEKLTEMVVSIAIGLVMERSSVNKEEFLPDKSPNAYDNLAWKQLCDNITTNVNSLPGKEKAVVNRHYFQGMAFVQIASLLKVSKGRVSQIHSSALRILRKRLKSLR